MIAEIKSTSMNAVYCVSILTQRSYGGRIIFSGFNTYMQNLTGAVKQICVSCLTPGQRRRYSAFLERAIKNQILTGSSVCNHTLSALEARGGV